MMGSCCKKQTLNLAKQTLSEIPISFNRGIEPGYGIIHNSKFLTPDSSFFVFVKYKKALVSKNIETKTK